VESYFPTTSQAAKAYNLSTGAIQNRCKSNNYPEYYRL